MPGPSKQACCQTITSIILLQATAGADGGACVARRARATANRTLEVRPGDLTVYAQSMYPGGPDKACQMH